MRKVYLLRRAPIHPCTDPIRVPARIIAQHPDGQIRGLSQSNTTMTEIPPGLREEFLRGSVVHVHAVVIRENKFHESERVLGTRRLPNAKLDGPQLREHVARDRSRRDCLLAAVYHLKSLFR